MDTQQKAATRFAEKIDKVPNGCWRWLGVLSVHGYAMHYVGSRVVLGHIFAYETYIGSRKPKRDGHVGHTCGDRACVNPENNGKCKWPSEVVQEIRKLRGVMPGATVAARYGMPLSTVYGYWHGSRRKHC